MTSNRKVAARNLRWDRWYAKVAHRITGSSRRCSGQPVTITGGFIGRSRQQKMWRSR